MVDFPYHHWWNRGYSSINLIISNSNVVLMEWNVQKLGKFSPDHTVLMLLLRWMIHGKGGVNVRNSSAVVIRSIPIKDLQLSVF